MPIEIFKDVVVPLVSVVIGSVITIVTSWWVTKQQLSISRKGQKIEELRRQISKLEDIYNKYTDLVNVSDPALSTDQINSAMIDAYIRSSKSFCDLGYFFPEEYVDKVQILSDEISAYIRDTKMSLPINEEKARASLVNVENQRKEISELVRNLLRLKHFKLEKCFD